MAKNAGNARASLQDLEERGGFEDEWDEIRFLLSQE